MAQTSSTPSLTGDGAAPTARNRSRAERFAQVESVERQRRRRMGLDWWRTVRATSRTSAA